MKVIFNGLTTQYIQKPGSRTGYTKGTISYTYNGEAREQSIMSFANPAVFAAVQGLVTGAEIEVTTGKNKSGYNEWVSVNAVGAAGQSNTDSSPSTPTTGSSAVRVSGSNYETREERANRQVLIVRQSSLSAAVASLTPGAKSALDPEAVIETAKQFEEYVFSTNDEGND